MITTELFGTTEDGLKVTKFILKNNHGFEIHLLSYGLIIQKIIYPTQQNTPQDIVLGFDHLHEYEKDQLYLGCLVGRNANRLSNGTIIINNTEVQLTQNESDKQLHGGFDGFNKKNWICKIIKNKVVATYVSPHLEEGFPGELTTSITFELLENNELIINSKATTTETTVVNLTRHDYFNLKDGGISDIKSHQIQINADSYTPTDHNNIVTGELLSVTNTPYDLRDSTIIKNRLRNNQKELSMGFDTNYAVNSEKKITSVAKVTEPISGRKLEVLSTQPGIQFYTAAYLKNIIGKNGMPYDAYHGFCLETQHFPDATKHLHFDSTIITKEKPYTQNLIYKFTP